MELVVARLGFDDFQVDEDEVLEEQPAIEEMPRLGGRGGFVGSGD